jgi:hypothetical protein
MATKIDLEQLRNEIQKIHRSHKLYKVLKEELTKQGYWKNKKRGDPVKAFSMRKIS